MESRRPNEYASFKVSVPLPYKEEIRKTETWPTNVQIIIMSSTSESFIYIICCDFNINLNADNNNVEQFLSILSCYGAVPVIREYTRVTSTSNTCIDNIIVDNTLDYTAHSLFSGISDHKAQVLELDLRLESIVSLLITAVRAIALKKS
ncbi:hypothetical protein QE152_g15151 [Popillia japonica]|uniref:Uncharacterized protein n=1 Tax=Popillia japonica TaxID=7064 RepID=A0AAW1L9W2_POPJA